MAKRHANFDDAVFARSRTWLRLVVAIADVSDYVQPGMALDREAALRGQSVYFPRREDSDVAEKCPMGFVRSIRKWIVWPWSVT